RHAEIGERLGESAHRLNQLGGRDRHELAAHLVQQTVRLRASGGDEEQVGEGLNGHGDSRGWKPESMPSLRSYALTGAAGARYPPPSSRPAPRSPESPGRAAPAKTP